MVLQHTLYLRPVEVQHLVRLANIELGVGSPLSYLDGRYGDETDWSKSPALESTLVDKGALRAEGKPNQLVASALLAAAQPDEVLSLAIGDTSATGLTIVRRGRMTAECTVGAGGLTKIVTPLDRSTVLVGLMKMLSGPTPDVAAGFHFDGDAKQAFVLSTALRLRGETGDAPSLADLAKAVAAGLSGPLAWSLKIAAGPDSLTTLQDPDLVDLTVRRLVDAGHVVLAQGALHFAPALMAVSAEEPTAMFAFSRSELTGGQMETAQITVTRTGPYRLLFRSLKGARFEWRDVTQLELRRLITAMWLTPEERTATAG